MSIILLEIIEPLNSVFLVHQLTYKSSHTPPLYLRLPADSITKKYLENN